MLKFKYTYTFLFLFYFICFSPPYICQSITISPISYMLISIANFSFFIFSLDFEGHFLYDRILLDDEFASLGLIYNIHVINDSTASYISLICFNNSFERKGLCFRLMRSNPHTLRNGWVDLFKLFVKKFL